jgi:regulator of protease activity HflC (stomatin/prohibitin superfamily)
MAFLLLVLIVAVIVVLSAVKIVGDYEEGVVERFGSYQRTVGPGIHVIIPFIERMNKTDMRDRSDDGTPR